MVSIQAAKSKGSQFEMDVQWSLRAIFPDIARLGGEGQYREIDLESRNANAVFECKRHKGFTWNELVKIYTKMKKRSPDSNERYLVFQANRQPPLVFSEYVLDGKNTYVVHEFEALFGTFEKHKPMKKGDVHA